MTSDKKSSAQVLPTRHGRIITLLSGAKEMTVQELAERLSVNARTIRRDLRTLLQNNVPLIEQIGPHGIKYWHIDEQTVGGMTFNYDEAAALYLGRRFLKPLVGTFLWEAADSALMKIRSRLGSQTVRNLERLLNIFTDSAVEIPNKMKGELLESLLFGCEESREVTITYRSLAAKEEETYVIRPYEILDSGGTIYIIGFSCKSHEMRQWRLERMSAALVTNRKFTRPKRYEFTPFTVASDNKAQKVCVRFSPAVARYVLEQKWHQSEKFTELSDGSVMVEYELPTTVFIKNRVLSYGANAEILEPESLREEMREITKLMWKKYE